MIVVRVYKNYWSDVVIHQQYLTDDIEIKDDLLSFSTATFKIDNYRIQKYNKVEIYEVWTPDKLKFKWVVKSITKTASALSEESELVCWDWKGLLQDRWPLYWYEEISTPLNTVVSRMMNLWNWLWDQWTYQIDYTDPIDMEYQLWTTCYNIIQELADQVGAFWTVKDGTIVMSEIIGQDKTFGSNTVSLFFDKSIASNVKNVYEEQGENRANIAIGIANDWAKLMKYQPEDYPYWVVIENFQTWDLEKKTLSLLEKNNIDKRSIGVELDENIDYNVSVWDKVNLTIEWLKTIDDFSWAVFVTSKTTTYKYGKRYEVIEVGNARTETGTLSSLIKMLNDKIDKIRNK